MNTVLSEEDLEIFKNYNEAMISWEKEFMKDAPICHFKKMSFFEGEEGEGAWWECLYCGHSKDSRSVKKRK